MVFFFFLKEWLSEDSHMINDNKKNDFSFCRTCDPLLRDQKGIRTLLGVRVERGSFTPVERRLSGPPGLPGAPAVTFLPEGKAEQSTQAPYQPLHCCQPVRWIDGRLLMLPPSPPRPPCKSKTSLKHFDCDRRLAKEFNQQRC